MSVVLDSSYAMACVMPDEERPGTMPAVLCETLIVPFTWPVEVANAMRSALRRKRLSNEEVTLFARRIAALDPKVVAPWHNDVLRYLGLGAAHELTPYDAIYVDLCLAEHSALATCDLQLARSAARVGIHIHS